MKCVCVGSIVALAAAAAHGQTVTVFQSGFEPGEGYAIGALDGQNGWSVYQGEDPSFGRVVGVSPLSGSQSILLRGQDVEIGSFGNYAGVGRNAPIAPSMNGNPLRFIEITGLCAIDDPTLQTNHQSIGGISLYHDDAALVTSVGPLSELGKLEFGWLFPDVVPVQPGVAFEFRHLVDYQTGLATQWMNGQLVYQNFAPAFNPGYIPTMMFFEMASLDLLPFDTQVWFDDMHMTATYVPSPGASLLAMVAGVACLRRRRPAR